MIKIVIFLHFDLDQFNIIHPSTHYIRLKSNKKKTMTTAILNKYMTVKEVLERWPEHSTLITILSAISNPASLGAMKKAANISSVKVPAFVTVVHHTSMKSPQSVSSTISTESIPRGKQKVETLTIISGHDKSDKAENIELTLKPGEVILYHWPLAQPVPVKAACRRILNGWHRVIQRPGEKSSSTIRYRTANGAFQPSTN